MPVIESSDVVHAKFTCQGFNLGTASVVEYISLVRIIHANAGFERGTEQGWFFVVSRHEQIDRSAFQNRLHRRFLHVSYLDEEEE